MFLVDQKQIDLFNLIYQIEAGQVNDHQKEQQCITYHSMGNIFAQNMNSVKRTLMLLSD